MQIFTDILNSASSFIWGPFTLILLVAVGIYLTVGLRFIPWRKLIPGFLMLWQGRKATGDGEITPYQALMTALSATIGTGNIAGVATAITLGGPGAIFWMWVTALFGMATKYCEAVLAVHFRETDENGNYVGGPMYYIKNGMGRRWLWLGSLFSFFGMTAGFGIGNMVQANSVADAVNASFNIPSWLTGLLIMVLAGAVILGGIHRIAIVASKLVPLMAIAYILGALVIILFNIDKVPGALLTIINQAFTGSAAAGGFAGATIWAAIRFGVARGIFSNEAGLGSAPIAHAAAKTSQPTQQGMIGMLGTFIDTVIVCTMTALVIIISGAWMDGSTGASLSALAFETGIPNIGGHIVTFSLVIFAFTTILGWSYYGERCAEYLFGVRSILYYRLLWLIALPIGAMGKLAVIWLLADVLNGLMALPNLIALVILSPVVFRLTKLYFNNE
ncbi:MAG: alanine/glycine:cation symporter family protein [Gammaproteobacteria bacterium]